MEEIELIGGPLDGIKMHVSRHEGQSATLNLRYARYYLKGHKTEAQYIGGQCDPDDKPLWIDVKNEQSN